MVGVVRPFDADYFFASNSLMLDRPYLGQKVFDVLRVLDWLRDQGHTEIHLAAKGWGALAATFAALLNPSVIQVTLKNALQSFATVAEAEDFEFLDRRVGHRSTFPRFARGARLGRRDPPKPVGGVVLSSHQS